MNKKLAIVEYHNRGTFLYRFTSNKEITLTAVVEYLEEVEGWNDERDNIIFFEDANTIKINLDEVLTKEEETVE